MKDKEPPTPNEPKEPAVPFQVPMSIIRCVAYSISFAALIIPFVEDTRQLICGGLILGWFAGLLNGIKNKS